MMKERIIEFLRGYITSTERIMSDPKIKTPARKKLKLLDEWHMIWALCGRSADTAYERCVYMSIYNMITSTILGDLTLDETEHFINETCYNLINGWKR